MSARFFALGCLGLLTACGRAPVVHHSILVSALVDGDTPLAGVRVAASGQFLGVTNAEGRFVTEIRSVDGEEISLKTECPSGFHGASEPESLRLSTVRPLGAGGDTVVVSVPCNPEKRRIAIVVSSPDFSNVPVVVNGAPRARTDAGGTAHVLALAAPGDVLSVSLDTSARRDLAPPVTHSLRVADADQVLVVNDAQPDPGRFPAFQPSNAIRHRLPARLYRIQ